MLREERRKAQGLAPALLVQRTQTIVSLPLGGVSSPRVADDEKRHPT